VTRPDPRGDAVFERATDRMAMLRHDRPQRLTAMTRAGMRHLGTLLQEIGEDPTVGVAILTGSGRGVCAGLDISGGELDVQGTARDITECSVLQETCAGAIPIRTRPRRDDADDDTGRADRAGLPGPIQPA
jgi:enoyl-CoA hydratase/carnithine racemase